jgi:hypothetical protein
MAISNLAKLRLLLWKNYILQKRQKLQTILEIFFPLVFVVVLVAVRAIINSEKYPDGMTFPSFQPTEVNRTVLYDNIFAKISPDVQIKK